MKNIHINRLLILTVFLQLMLISACNFSTVRVNEKSDQTIAENFTREFYQKLKMKAYNNSLKFYADTFLKKIDTGYLFTFYKKYEKKCGEITDISLIKCETKTLNKNNNIFKSYVVLYKVERSFNPTQERFILKSVGTDKPSIYRYDIFEKPVGILKK